jgi:hypothetical protein
MVPIQISLLVIAGVLLSIMQLRKVCSISFSASVFFINYMLKDRE